VLREDVEDQLRAIEHLEIGGLRDVSELRGRQLAVEDQGLGAQVHGAHEQLLELAAADAGAAVELVAAGEHAVEQAKARGVGEALELVQGARRQARLTQGEADEDRAWAVVHR